MRKLLSAAALGLLLTVGAARAQTTPDPVTLTLVGYAVPREAYSEIIPLFQEYWLAATGQEVTFEESWAASGAQSRAVGGGFEADVVALSQEQHVSRIADAGLITTDWQDNGYNGVVSSSLAVIVVRPGNPLGINDWADLAREGVEVVTPDPATSGGAQWNVMAAYGAAYRGHVEGYEAGEAGALQFITNLFTNVSVLDADGRESFLTFERGIADAAITYENEYYAGVIAGGEYDIVYPSSTLLIENPIAVVDVYADRHGVREVAEAFVAFTYTPEAQAVFAAYGFRPPLPFTASADPEATPEAEATAEAVPAIELDPERFPPVDDQFTIRDFGGWGEVVPTVFGEEGLFTRMIAEVQGG